MSAVPAALRRRESLRTTALGLLALPHIDPGSLPTRRVARSRVALVRTSDRAAGVAAALRLLDPPGIAGRQVLIKPNFNSADPAPGSTHNDTLVALIAGLRARNARSVGVGESSGPGSTRQVMEQKGIFDLAADHRFDLVNYEEIPEGDWVRFGPEGTHWPEGFWLPRHVVEAEYNVSTCCLKTHGFGGVFTMSLKLSVGLTPKSIRRGMHRSPDMRRMIAELNTGYRPDLVVLDGVEAFTDGGPGTGERKRGDVMIAGHDRVAVDAVGLAVLKELGSNDAIMGRGIFEQDQIARAVELGLGARGAEGIELVTGDDVSASYARQLEVILARG